MGNLASVSTSSQAFLVPANGRGLIAPPTVNPDNSSTPGLNFTSQVTMSEHHHDELEIEQHPIQVGAPIADHAFVKPAELTLNLMFVPPGGSSGFTLDAKNYIQYVYSQLESGKSNRVLYTVYTTKRIYTQMLIKSITTETDATKQNILEITLQMQQVLLTSAQYFGQGVTSPPGNQLSPQDTNPVQSQGFQSATALAAGVSAV